MVVGNFNDDITPTIYLDDGIYHITITSGDYYRYEYIDAACFARTEHVKSIRSGWNNPKKIAIPKNNKPHNIMMQTRNQLPYKFRRIDSN